MKFEINLKEDKSGIELTPLIDVLFQLLVFFMLTSSFSLPNMEINLPHIDQKSDSYEAPKITVSLNLNGDLYINHQFVETLFESALKKELALEEENTVHLNADSEIKYSKILNIMKRIRDAGANQINFLHEDD
jgi:biopolymer transport protein ExbD|tara:strand:- start:2680 stop:3078 length:399 start_codon:yes stop_codon:yes gene_type:complete